MVVVLVANVFGGEVEDEVKDIDAESGTGISTPATAGETGKSMALEWLGATEEVSTGVDCVC